MKRAMQTNFVLKMKQLKTKQCVCVCVCVCSDLFSIHLQQGVKTQSVYLNQTWANNALETRSLIGCSPAFIILGLARLFVSTTPLSKILKHSGE